MLGLVFYGYGFGLFGRLDLARGLGLVLAICGAQVVARW
ncbi:DUF418 domain-containing protein [Methylobacterium tarhaniae]|nr:DUF418 domain-containing protein [Methylobacterium tarhaniae]